MQPRLTDEGFKEICRQQDADKRVWELMDIICSEFQSDPMSVQCFDLRVVDEAIKLVRDRKEMKDPFNPFNKVQKENLNKKA